MYTGTQSQPASVTAIPTFPSNLGVHYDRVNYQPNPIQLIVKKLINIPWTFIISSPNYKRKIILF